MIIQFPEYVNYKYFYGFSLRRLMHFLNVPDEELLIDFQNTVHLAPSVICDFLCYLKLLNRCKYCRVHIIFGKSHHLSSYLNDSQFFLLSEGWDLFTTDVLAFNTSSSGLRKTKNIDAVKKIRIPANSGPDLPFSEISQIQRQIFMLYREEKINNMNRFGLDNPEKLAAGYIEILENSYEHSNKDSNNELTDAGYFFYTFQNYQKTGLSFANSDTGVGLYRSLEIKYSSKASCNDNIALERMPNIFTLDEFMRFKTNEKDKNLAGIIESIVFRLFMRDKRKRDCGFNFIFNTLVLPCDGMVAIHSGNVLLVADGSFINEFFVVENNKIVECHKEKLRSIIFDPKVQQALNAKGILRDYDYSFPGVHIAVQVRKGGAKENVLCI